MSGCFASTDPYREQRRDYVCVGVTLCVSMMILLAAVGCIAVALQGNVEGEEAWLLTIGILMFLAVFIFAYAQCEVLAGACALVWQRERDQKQALFHIVHDEGAETDDDDEEEV